MRVVIERVHEETFTFTPNDGTPEVTIRSGRLREWLLARAMHKVIELTFPEQTLEEIVEQHGLEAPRMASMTEAEALEPVIVGLWPGGTHILIDGGHRRWYWAKRGVNVLKGWAVPKEAWEAFIFDPGDSPFAFHLPDGTLLPHRRK